MRRSSSAQICASWTSAAARCAHLLLRCDRPHDSSKDPMSIHLYTPASECDPHTCSAPANAAGAGPDWRNATAIHMLILFKT